MPLRSDWAIGREGFTFDTILSLLKYTALDPRKTLPLYLAALYTSKGREIALQRPNALKWLKVLLSLGIANRVKNFLDEGVSNNWKNDKYNWNREIVAVTGGSDGIGAIIVQMLAERGIHVVVLDIQKPKFITPPNVHYFHCDLANPAAIKATAAEVQKHVGHPTILVNNAGFARGKSILATTDTDLKLTFQINAIAHYQLAQAYLPNMIQNNHGMVVTVASLASYVTAPNLVDYAASKAAALTFHEGLQAELATIYNAPKVRTVLCCQGYTNTALFAGFDKGDGFLSYMLDPATVAEHIVKAILAGRSEHIILPKGNTLMSNLKGFPTWMQVALRKDLTKLMSKWSGRQVVQPSEVEDAPTGEESVFEEIEAAK